MAVTLYKSTDASAPVLTGQVGSLVALLDACLVNGYTGKAAAGWVKAFSGANLASYRMATVGATGFYLDVVDSGSSGTLGPRSARCRGYETMTGLSAGTGAFPTTAVAVNGIQIFKSATADATARPWILLADNKTFTLLTNPGTDALSGWSTFHFGDIFSLKPADAYRAIIIGRSIEAVAPGANLPSEEHIQDLTAVTTLAAGHWMPRTFAGASALAVNVGKHSGDNAKRGFVPYPNPPDNSLMLSQFWIHEPLTNLGAIRGRLRGLWDFLHDPMAPVNDGDTAAGSGALAGKTFLVARPVGGSTAVTTTVRVLVLETSDTWETST